VVVVSVVTVVTGVSGECACPHARTHACDLYRTLCDPWSREYAAYPTTRGYMR
jgi:hypothetical protein